MPVGLTPPEIILESPAQRSSLPFGYMFTIGAGFITTLTINCVPTQPFAPVGIAVYLTVIGLVPKLVIEFVIAPVELVRPAPAGSGSKRGKFGTFTTEYVYVTCPKSVLLF